MNFAIVFWIFLARSVSYICTDDNQCGAGECKAGRCACRGNQRIEEMQDIDNRNIQYCVQLNGKNQMIWKTFLLYSQLSLSRCQSTLYELAFILSPIVDMHSIILSWWR